MGSLYDGLRSIGEDPHELYEDKSIVESTFDFGKDVATGVLSAPADLGAGIMNTGLDATEALGINRGIYTLINGDDVGYEDSIHRFAGVTETLKGEGEVSGTQEFTADMSAMLMGTLVTGGFKAAKPLTQWANSGGIGKKLVGEALLMLPTDIAMSDDSGEHLLFEDNADESGAMKRAKSIAENALVLGPLGDIALRVISKPFRKALAKGKTKDDAIQSAFNEGTDQGSADATNKVRTTAELNNNPHVDPKVYEDNPLYKMDNRKAMEEAGDSVPGDKAMNQMGKVYNMESKARHTVQKEFDNASKKSDVEFNKPPEGISKEEHLRDASAKIDGVQDKEDFLNMFDLWSSGGIKDERASDIFQDFIQDMLDTEIDDVAHLMRQKPGSEDRKKAMRAVRNKFADNPTILSPRMFEDKARLSKVLSKRLGLVPKKSQSLTDIFKRSVKMSEDFAENKELSKAFSKLAKDTGMSKKVLIRNMAELGVVTEHMPVYMRSLIELKDSTLAGMHDSAVPILKQVKETGKLDISSPEFGAWVRAFGAGTEVYAGVAGVASNIGRTLRVMRENAGGGVRSYLDEFVEKGTKGIDPKAQETATSYMRMQSLVNQQLNTKHQLDEVQKKLIKMIKTSLDKNKTQNMLKSGDKVFRDDKDLTALIIAQGIAGLLSSPATLSRIAANTAIYSGYKQTLIPMYAGLTNTVKHKVLGQASTGETMTGVVRRLLGASRVAMDYTLGREKGSRGVLGMEIEGMGFSALTFKEINKKVSSYDSATKRGLGHMLTGPMVVGNFFMRGVKNVDDFFRRFMLEAETEGAVHEMYFSGIHSNRSSNITQFENFEDYRKVMLPLFHDIRGALFDARKGSTEDIAKAVNKAFDKYDITKGEANPYRNIIMSEVERGERKAAEAVSQETVSDTRLGKLSKSAENIFGDTPLGRVALATMMPFRTAPINIIRASMEETPGIQFLSKRFRDRLFRGTPKERNEATAQILAGTTLGVGAWGVINALPVYGHIPLEERHQASQVGIEPYSIVLEGKSYSYEFLGVFKAGFAALADYKRYSQGGTPSEGLMYGMKNFVIAAQDSPYLDAMSSLLDLFNSEASEKQIATFMTSKATQFLQPGAGIMRSITPLTNKGAIETSSINSELDGWYNNVWLQKLDNNNKNNPAYRVFRNMVDPKAYTTKTNIFGDNIMRNGPSGSSYLPYLLTGTNTIPVDTSPGMTMLRELELVNQDYTKIGDVVLDSERSKELQKRVFSDEGFGVKRMLDAYATDSKFMNSTDSYRKQTIESLIKDTRTMVESNFSLDVVHRQTKIDELRERLDFESAGGFDDAQNKSEAMAEKIYRLDVRKRRRANSSTAKAIESLETGTGK